MKNISSLKILIIILIAVSGMVLLQTTPSQKDFLNQKQQMAAPVFFTWGEEKIVKVANFPNDYPYDAGIIYKQITIFFIPLWNYDVRWCGYTGSNKNYLQVSKAAIFEIADYENIKLPKDPESKIPFWQRIGGKLVLLGILLVYLFVQFKPFKRKPESTPAPVPTNKGNNASGSAS